MVTEATCGCTCSPFATSQWTHITQTNPIPHLFLSSLIKGAAVHRNGSIFILQWLYVVLDYHVITVNSTKSSLPCRLIWPEQKTSGNSGIALGAIPLDGQSKDPVMVGQQI